jgi:hypothetical protein
MLDVDKYVYQWHSVEGKPEDGAAHADTQIGRIKVQRRRPGVNKFVAWVRGDVIGREYINMDTAKRAAETKVMKILKERETA